MNRFRALFQAGVRDRVLLLNLVLRAAACVWVLTLGSALLGDSEYYLSSMRGVWSGAWGGDPFRAPGYSWFLALFGGPLIALPLQSLILWFVGVHLRENGSRKVAQLWLFDPVLFVYSHAIMSDALFAVCVYVSALVFRSFLSGPNGARAFRLGVTIALTMLFRPVGIPFALLTFVFAAFVFSRLETGRNRAWRSLALSATLALLLILPRLGWNARMGEGWTIASQGKTFQMAVAGIVENAGQGLSFYEAEKKWFADHPDLEERPRAARNALIENSKTWFLLSVKGAARTLFGHANIEIGNMATAREVIGPGWFSEGNPGTPWSTRERILWIAGLLLTLSFASFEYWTVLRGLPRAGLSDRRWTFWMLLGCIGFVLAPQVYGDCRFRLPVLALVFSAAVVKCRSDGARILGEPVPDRS